MAGSSLDQIHEDLGELKADVRNILASQQRTETTLAQHALKDEERFTSLEHAQARAKGAIWAAGILAAGLSSVVGWAFGRH